VAGEFSVSIRRQFAASLSFVLFLALGSPLHAQQRPLLTEDPETVGAGLVLLEAGFDVQRGLFYPVSGLEGNLLRAPVLGVSLGVGPFAELQVDGGFYNRLNITSRAPAPLSDHLEIDGDRTTDVEDLVLGTKLRLLSEGPSHPALGIRFATRLPNAGNESGLGTDTLEFNVSALIGKTVRSLRVVGNVGLAVFGDPTRGDRQGDLLTYGFSLARALRQGLEVVGEVNGRYVGTGPEDTPPGGENRAAMRFGTRFTTGTFRLDAGAIVGMTSRDPSIGFTAGFTWVFRAFTTP
jgi:hypothetical protein